MPKGIRHTVTDGQILAEYYAGRFIAQIKRDHHVGVHRIRKVLDAAGINRHGEAVA